MSKKRTLDKAIRMCDLKRTLQYVSTNGSSLKAVFIDSGNSKPYSIEYHGIGKNARALLNDSSIVKYGPNVENTLKSLSKANDSRIYGSNKMCDENSKLVNGMLSQLREMLKRYKSDNNRKKLVFQYIENMNNARVSGRVSEEEYQYFVKNAKEMI